MESVPKVYFLINMQPINDIKIGQVVPFSKAASNIAIIMPLFIIYLHDIYRQQIHCIY